ncbi:MAG: bifunctional (p)ppGpp synthetase/guanosine-3',5'-bis(diphosphate) 3'-pyrophosphohydrolase [Candidatus Marsarchaeota archaeon]|nr:bifunctional (p)ppGpp synthetase/guanosine-3',5'-bis(diphosphate) 3'-pyrophosphohydrolase [Candidatus Marsarchaeota archaeon]
MGNVAVAGQVETEISGLEFLQSTYLARHPKYSTALIEKAWYGSIAAHVGQVRASGEPYFVHPYGVARIVAALGVDDVTIAAALLHDSVEDTNLSLDEVSNRYDPAVAAIVDGVTKIDRLSFESKEAQQAASMRKMLLAMAKDPRVLVIKLADRLHNMKTIGALPEWKQRRTAQETLDIYAPLAHRLGIQEIRWQLEDLAFATLHPRRYAEIDRMVTSRNPEREQYLDTVLKAAKDRLEEVGIKAEVSGRPKHLWSIYEKMVVKAKEFDDIYDIIGMRVITETEKDCWAALGVVHSIWSPVPGRFKDYINSPKFNLYQSLHTTVVSHGGNPLEIQIRTQDMHKRAEFGVAAHWGYKEGSSKEEIVWLNRIVDWQGETPDPAEFLEFLRLDLELDEVYVFSPKGKVISLPAGATPIDFAYSIHTEVGHRCIGAKVNQRLVPLDSKLKSGDTVEIFTSKVQNAGPSRDWLKIVVTPRARNKIRQWFSRERREDAIESGKDELNKAMRKENLPVQKLSNSEPISHISEALGYSDLESLYAAIGQGHVSSKAVAQRLARELKVGDGEDQLPSTVTSSRTLHRKRKGAGVYVEGLDDVMIRLSKCCSPVPGDDITGFVTRGRGVSVHRTDCSNAVALASSNEDRLIEVEWDRDTTGIFAATVEIKALDRSHLLADVTRVLSEHHLNILSSSSPAGADRVSRMRFEFELADPSHLESVLASIKRLDSVFDAYRVLPAKSR